MLGAIAGRGYLRAQLKYSIDTLLLAAVLTSPGNVGLVHWTLQLLTRYLQKHLF